MTDSRYGYCSVYVKAPDATMVTGLLVNALDAGSEDDNIRLPGVIMDARTNPDVEDVSPPSDDFVRWPVLIEVDADDADDGATMVAVISRVLSTLWDAGYPTVVACDFEDELPWGGGIRRLAETN
jgi:hypothetical protein